MSANLVPWVVDSTVVLALVVGLGRLSWLFLSPVPTPAATVERGRRPKLATWMPLLFLGGCLVLAPCGALMWWLKHAPTGFQNIIPLILVYVLAFAGGGAILIAVLVQGLLVRAYRGGVESADYDRHQLQNFDALLLGFLGILLIVLLQAHRLAPLDVMTADATAIEQRQSIVRAFAYWTLIASSLRLWMRRPSEEGVGRKQGWHAALPGLVLFMPFGWFADRLVLRDRDIERFVDNRDAFWFHAASDRLEVPTQAWQGDMVILVGAAYAAAMAIGLMAGMLVPGNAQTLKRGALGRVALFVALAAAAVQFYLAHVSPPDGTARMTLADIVLPLLAGLAIAPLMRIVWHRLQPHLFSGGADMAQATAMQMVAVICLMIILGIGIFCATTLSNLQMVVGFLGITIGTSVLFDRRAKVLEPSVTTELGLSADK